MNVRTCPVRELDEFLTKLGQEIRSLRRARKMTQSALADVAELDLRNYQNIEAGKIEVRLKTLGKIAQALGTTVTALLRPMAPNNPLGGQSVVAAMGITMPFDFDQIRLRRGEWDPLPFCASIADATGLVRYASQKWQEVTGIAPADAIGRMYVWEAHPEQHREFARHTFLQAIAKEVVPTAILVEAPSYPGGVKRLRRGEWEYLRGPRQERLGLVGATWFIDVG